MSESRRDGRNAGPEDVPWYEPLSYNPACKLDPEVSVRHSRIAILSLLAALALIFLAATSETKSDPSDAARLNNLGCAYMNQQLFEKALNFFEAAAKADPNLRVAKLNQGIALLALAKVDAAKAILDEAAK